MTGYPAWVPWFCGFVRVAGLGGHIGGVLGGNRRALSPHSARRKVAN